MLESANQQGSETGEAVHNFVRTWMGAYLELQKNNTPSSLPPECEFLAAGASIGLQDIFNLCVAMAGFDFDWAQVISQMLEVTATALGEDENWSLIPARAENRVPALAQTDLLVPMALAPVSRTTPGQDDMLVYLGPAHDEYYTTPISLTFSVTKEGATFSIPKFQIATQPAPEAFRWDQDWNAFAVPYDNETQYLLSTTALPNITSTDLSFAAPFGGTPTLSQVAAATSATASGFSAASPSVMAQLAESMQARFGSSSPLVALALQVFTSTAYTTRDFDDYSICSQWPNPCGTQNGRLLDGSFGADGPSIASAIARHQQQHDDTELKIIVTNHNYYTDTNVRFLAYFSTDFNQGIAPGDWIWPPGTAANDVLQPTPWASPQIFQDYMNDALFTQSMEPIADTNLTTALFVATTVDNVPYNITAGLQVQMLLIQINSNIPTFLLDLNTTEEYIHPLAELAQTIATNGELQGRIQDFVGTISYSPTLSPVGGGGPSVSPTPSSSATVSISWLTLLGLLASSSSCSSR
jgi:hypothetical protein